MASRWAANEMSRPVRRRGTRRALAAVSASVLLLGVTVAAFLGGAGGLHFLEKPLVVRTAAGASISMTVSDALAFTPNAISNLVPGSSITVTIQNLGHFAHTFTVSSFVNYTLPYLNNNNLTAAGGFLTQHPALFSGNITASQGSVTPFTFTAPSKIGSYQFFCTISGHFPLGMEGFLGVGVAVGSVSVNTGPGLPVFIISGVIVALVVLAIVLGFVVGRRKGSRHEMPPERLGYSETTPSKPPDKPR